MAVIKPSKLDTPMQVRIDGNQINLQGASLRFLITFAWGLEGNYDFAIEFTPQRGPEASSPSDSEPTGPMYQQALLEQTGLKLMPQKGSVDTIIVDHIERPSAN